MALKTTVQRNVTIEVPAPSGTPVQLRLQGSDDQPQLWLWVGNAEKKEGELLLKGDAWETWTGREAVLEALADLRAAVAELERHLGVAPAPTQRAPYQVDGPEPAAEPVGDAPMAADAKPTAPPPGLLTSLAARVAAAQALAGSKAPAEPLDPADAERARAAAYGYALDEGE